MTTPSLTCITLLFKSVSIACVVAIVSACSDQNGSVVDSALSAPVNDLAPIDEEFEPIPGSPPLQKPQVNNPVVVRAPQLQWADANMLILLEGNGQSANEGGIARYSWVQTSGPEAYILQPNQQSTLVLLPDVKQAVDVSFRLAAVDFSGYVNSSFTRLHVLPVVTPFKVASVGVYEDSDQAMFAVTLKEPASTDLQLSYSTADASARAGADYQVSFGVATIIAGKRSVNISVPLIDNELRHANKMFELQVSGEYEGTALGATAVAVIMDDEEGPLLGVAPELQGPADITQTQLGGEQAVVRFHLQWAEPQSELALSLVDPCGNNVAEDSPQADCHQARGEFMEAASEGGFTQNVSWVANAAAGVYTLRLTHAAGVATDYVLRVYIGDESFMYSGRLGDGEITEPLVFEFTGGLPDGEPLLVEAVGKVINAVSGTAIHAEIIVRRTELDPVLMQVQTGEEGIFSFTIEEGVYYLEVVAEGFSGWHNEVNLSAGRSLHIEPALSPVLIDQAARIVLQWGETPRDLDSHLRGPLPSGGEFHIFYGSPAKQGVAELDLDDTDSFGPETTTLLSRTAGTYRYYVHDYTNGSASDSTALANSRAVVKVFSEDGEEYTFTVPQGAGTYWLVFEMDGASGVITPINTIVDDVNAQPAALPE